MLQYHILTGEYPPQIGGVSDYTYVLSSELASLGHKVHIWCPPTDGKHPEQPGVIVHRDLGNSSRAELKRVGEMLSHYGERRQLLVQWVPHSYGYQSMNLGFCLWVWQRAILHHDRVEIMVHEPYLPFRWGAARQNAAAVIHRIMISVLLNVATRVWVSVPLWQTCLRRYALGRSISFTWIPVPSNIPVVADSQGVAAVRASYVASTGFLVGHFGTYTRGISELVSSVVPKLLERTPAVNFLLLGKGSVKESQALLSQHPTFAGRIHGTGQLSATDLSRHLSACDLLLQPYPDGVSTRRSTVMAGLAHGVPVVTTMGKLTETLWAESRAVALAPVDADRLVIVVKDLLSNAKERTRLRCSGTDLYEKRFDIRHTISALKYAHGSRPPE